MLPFASFSIVVRIQWIEMRVVAVVAADDVVVAGPRVVGSEFQNRPVVNPIKS